MHNTIYPVLENSVDIVTQRWSKGAEVWHGRPVLHGTTVPPPAAPKKKNSSIFIFGLLVQTRTGRRTEYENYLDRGLDRWAPNRSSLILPSPRSGPILDRITFTPRSICILQNVNRCKLTCNPAFAPLYNLLWLDYIDSN